MKALKICGNELLLTIYRDDVCLLTGSRDPNPKELIEAVIPMAQNIGFCKEKDRIVCEIFENDGTHLFFLTKSCETDSIKGETRGMKRYPDGAYIPEASDAHLTYIYEFSDFESLLSVCREISIVPEIDAKAMYDDDYLYLRLTSYSPLPAEFGARECDAAEIAAIEERCRALPYCAAELGALSKASH